LGVTIRSGNITEKRKTLEREKEVFRSFIFFSILLLSEIPNLRWERKEEKKKRF